MSRQWRTGRSYPGSSRPSSSCRSRWTTRGKPLRLKGGGPRVDNGDLLGVLRSIDRRLALLTSREERDVRAALVSEVLNTESRRKIFDAIDGVRGNPELATIGGVTPRATQNFV